MEKLCYKGRAFIFQIFILKKQTLVLYTANEKGIWNVCNTEFKRTNNVSYKDLFLDKNASFFKREVTWLFEFFTKKKTLISKKEIKMLGRQCK